MAHDALSLPIKGMLEDGENIPAIINISVVALFMSYNCMDELQATKILVCGFTEFMSLLLIPLFKTHHSIIPAFPPGRKSYGQEASRGAVPNLEIFLNFNTI